MTMHKILTILMALLFMAPSLHATPERPDFTGVVEMMLRMPSGQAEVTYHFGKEAQRMNMITQMDKLPDPLRSSVIIRNSRPDEARIINHTDKTWSKVNLRKTAEQSMLIDFDSNYRLEKLGREQVKGYPCEHIRLSTKNETIDLWMTSSLGDFKTFRLLQSQNPRLSNTSLTKTLSDAGVGGFPIKLLQKNINGTYRMELVQVWPQEVPEETFRVPDGYKKVKMEEARIGNDQKEHLKGLMEKMKKFEQ